MFGSIFVHCFYYNYLSVTYIFLHTSWVKKSFAYKFFAHKSSSQVGKSSFNLFFNTMTNSDDTGWSSFRECLLSVCPPTGRWSEPRVEVSFSSGVLIELELEKNGKYNWPIKNGSRATARLQIKSKTRSQYFADVLSMFASLQKKKKTLGEVLCVRTVSKHDIFDGDVWTRGTNKTLYYFI